MLNTLELLELAQSRAGNCTDYRLAILLDINQSTLIGYRNGQRRPVPAVCARLAELCGLDPLQVLVWVEYERARDDKSRQMWQALAARFPALPAGQIATPCPA